MSRTCPRNFREYSEKVPWNFQVCFATPGPGFLAPPWPGFLAAPSRKCQGKTSWKQLIKNNEEQQTPYVWLCFFPKWFLFVIVFLACFCMFCYVVVSIALQGDKHVCLADWVSLEDLVSDSCFKTTKFRLKDVLWNLITLKPSIQIAWTVSRFKSFLETSML